MIPIVPTTDGGDSFLRNYPAMLETVLALGIPTAVSTIYDANYADPEEHRVIITAPTIFNDCITREALARGLPLVDLRLTCDEPEDYVNPIEPSDQGGRKIAGAITRMLMSADPKINISRVYR